MFSVPPNYGSHELTQDRNNQGLTVLTLEFQLEVGKKLMMDERNAFFVFNMKLHHIIKYAVEKETKIHKIRGSPLVQNPL